MVMGMMMMYRSCGIHEWNGMFNDMGLLGE